MAAKVVASDPIQEQLILARRMQILDAATQVFAEKGFERATIRDVAKAAGIADGTIYNYFDNKTGLLFGLLDRLNETEHSITDLSQIDITDWREFWRIQMRQRLNVLGQTGLANFQVLLSEVMSNPEVRNLFLKQIIEPPLTIAEQYFQRLIDQGEIRPINLPLTMRIISASILGLIMLNVIGEPHVRADSNELADQMTSILLDGMATVKGNE